MRGRSFGVHFCPRFSVVARGTSYKLAPAGRSFSGSGGSNRLSVILAGMGAAETEDSSSLERLLKHGVWFYAMLVFVGFIDLYAYYTPFGIRIWSYMSTGEILLSFLSLTGPILVWCIVGAGGLLFFATMSGEEIKKFFIGMNRVLRLTAIFTNNFVKQFVFFIIVAFAWDIALFLSEGQHFFEWTWVGQVVTIAVFASFFAFTPLLRAYGWNKVTRSTGTVFVVLSLIAMSISRRELADGVMNHNLVLNLFSIQTAQGDTLSSEKNMAYVGQCNAAVFIYDRTTKRTIIIPSVQVIRMQVR